MAWLKPRPSEGYGLDALEGRSAALEGERQTKPRCSVKSTDTVARDRSQIPSDQGFTRTWGCPALKVFVYNESAPIWGEQPAGPAAGGATGPRGGDERAAG